MCLRSGSHEQDPWDLMHALASLSNTTTSRVRRVAPRSRNVSSAGHPVKDGAGCPNKCGPLSEAHLLRTGLSEAKLMSANLPTYLDGANAGVAARARRVDPRTSAGYRLQLPVGELSAFFSDWRGTGEHQVDSVRGLLDCSYLDALRQSRSQLMLYGCPGVLEQPSPEVVVLEAPLHEPALHLLTTRRFAHESLPLPSLKEPALCCVFSPADRVRRSQYPMLPIALQRENRPTSNP
jgi:hypothetical protein